MSDSESNLVDVISKQASDLYARLEEFTDVGSTESLLGVLCVAASLRAAIDSFDESAVAVLRRYSFSWDDIAAAVGLSSDGVRERFHSADTAFSGDARMLDSLLKASVTHRFIRGQVYTREDLRELLGTNDGNLNTGIYRPRGMAEIWLFVTENKQADRQQYVDKLDGDNLHWQGQQQGRKDQQIIDHRQNGDRILLFHRKTKYEFDHAGFRYEGPFEYVSHSGSQPTDFILRRQTPL